MAEDTNNTSNTEVKEDKKSSEGFKTVMKIAIGVILVIELSILLHLKFHFHNSIRRS